MSVNIKERHNTVFYLLYVGNAVYQGKSKGCSTLHWVSLTILRVRCSHQRFLQKHWVTGGNSCAHHSVPSKLPVSEAQPGDLW